MATSYLQIVCEKLCFNEVNEMLAAVGYGSLSVKQVANRLIAEQQREVVTTKALFITPKIVVKKNKDGILIDGDSGMLVRFANCCLPIMGDKIVGYISRGKGVTIHRANCHNVKFLEPERIIDADWNEKKGQMFETSLRIVSEPSNSYVQQMIQQIIESKTVILSFNSKTNNQNRMITILKIQVESNEQVNNVVRLIKSFKETHEVDRNNDYW